MEQTMYTTAIYDYYTNSGNYLGRREYCPTSKSDYDRVMSIIADDSTRYKLVNVEYEFEWKLQGRR